MYVLAGLFTWGTSGAHGSDIETIRARVIETFTGSPPPASRIEEWITGQQENGAWPDIDYKDRSRAGWLPVEALDRLSSMASAYRSPSHPLFQDQSILKTVNRGLDHWFKLKPKSDNWWWQDIGVPMQLGKVALLMDADLTDERRAQATVLMPEEPKMTGQNRVWTATGALYRGLLERNAQRVTAAFRGIGETIVISTGKAMNTTASFPCGTGGNCPAPPPCRTRRSHP